MEFSKRLDLFGDEIFAALNERKVALEAQGRTIYNLSVGTPDFAPAEHIRKAMMDAAADPQNWKYSLRDLPELLDADREQERILKTYIRGETVASLVAENRMEPDYYRQIEAMCARLYPANTNIDYYPTNFVVQDGTLYYIDFECNDYMQRWDYEHWGRQYWYSKTE